MTALDTLLPSFEKIRDLWQRCAQESDSDLLRLAIFRELQRSLHAQQSHFLAIGEASQARETQEWQSRVETLQAIPLDPKQPAQKDLAEFLRHPPRKTRDFQPIPPELFQAIDRTRLERLDRVWERALAARGCELGWKFWKMTARVGIAEVEAWNQRLVEALWPRGIILYAESGEFTDFPSGWRGSWILLLSPRMNPRTQEPQEFDFPSWPGFQGESPEWKLLFDPGKGAHEAG